MRLNFQKRSRLHVGVLLSIAASSIVFAQEAADSETEPDSSYQNTGAHYVPDLREEDIRLKAQRGDFVVVPIPTSSPTLGTGLILGGAYFYAQTEEQKEVQPASMTAVAGLYTNNDSYAYGLLQKNYWNEHRWRFSGLLAHADFKLDLRVPEVAGDTVLAQWFLRGNIFRAELSRQVAGNWYAGMLARYIDMSQDFNLGVSAPEFEAEPDMTSVGLGVTAEYDSRDQPFSSQKGMFFDFEALFNGEILGGTNEYQSYTAKLSSYHLLHEKWVLAWQARGCTKSGGTPLWDACTVALRGFPVTDYLGKSSVSGQAEIRWQALKRWGLVAFAGAGTIDRSVTQIDDDEIIPSYGVGIRFIVLKAKRINMRLDYARSDDSDAVYLAVGEAF